MKKIAIDCTHFVQGNVGGFESYLRNLLDGIAKINTQNITLFVLKIQKQHFQSYATCFEIKEVPAKNIIQVIAWQNIIFPLLSLQYDVVLFPSNCRPVLLFCKSVTVIHDIQYIHYPHYWSRLKLCYRKLFIPYSIRFSTQVIAISHTIKQEMNHHFRRSNINVIYNAININSEESTPPLNLRLPEQFFLVPSSLAIHKNIHQLVEAIRRLAVTSITLPVFIFIGTYKKADFTETVLPNHMVILGYVDTAVRNHLYSRCMSLVLPSIYEGFGMPYAEALLSNKPIIASDIPIARELLGENAMYIQPPYGPEQICLAIEQFLTHKPQDVSAQDVAALRKKTNVHYVASQYMDILNQ